MSEYVTLDNGESIYVEEYGDVSGETIIALHGLGGGGYFFSGLSKSLTSSSRVICPDMPGSGLSKRGERSISFDGVADAVVQPIQRKTVGQITLIGHSMGTITALKVYSRIPNRIRSMIFVGGLPTALSEAQARVRDRAALARSASMTAVAPTIVPVVFARRSFQVIPDKISMFQRLLALSDAEGYAQTALALADASAADVVHQVRVPCLCVTGTEDRYAPPAAVREFADSVADACYHELKDCAHMPFFEAPDLFGQAVQEFLCPTK